MRSSCPPVSLSVFLPRPLVRSSTRTPPCPPWSPERRTPSSTTRLTTPSSGSAPTGSMPRATQTRKVWCPGDQSNLPSVLLQESWRWDDGRRLNFTAWAPDQPNNYWWGERCIRSDNTNTNTTNTWDDHRCWLRTANALACQISFD